MTSSFSMSPGWESSSRAGRIRRAEPFLYDSGIDSLDFDPRVWATGRWKGRQEAVPAFSSIELLAVRSDLIEEAGLAYPKTFSGRSRGRPRIACRPRRGRFGVAWNARRGMPLASSFAFLLACCGGAVLPFATRPLRLVARRHRSAQKSAVGVDSDAWTKCAGIHEGPARDLTAGHPWKTRLEQFTRNLHNGSWRRWPIVGPCGRRGSSMTFARASNEGCAIFHSQRARRAAM